MVQCDSSRDKLTYFVSNGVDPCLLVSSELQKVIHKTSHDSRADGSVHRLLAVGTDIAFIHGEIIEVS